MSQTVRPHHFLRHEIHNEKEDKHILTSGGSPPRAELLLNVLVEILISDLGAWVKSMSKPPPLPEKHARGGTK